MTSRLLLVCLLGPFLAGCSLFRGDDHWNGPPPLKPAGPPPVVRGSGPKLKPAYATPVPDRPGFVYSPFSGGRIVDVRDVPRGTIIRDPYSGRPLIVP